VPLLSVIIPVYNVQAYLEECLDSVLGQGFEDLEVIAVDDRSPDHSPAMLDERAARDERLRVVHLEQNVGLGPARNAGLEHATGRYVMFLDSDDSLTPGSLQAIADQLEKARNPELLIVDHARTYWWGKVQRNLMHELLAELSQGPAFTTEEHPELFDLLHVAWNKVSRRDFLEREELLFPPGYYEDTPWTYKALLTAKSISTLPVVTVHYRQRRHGSILGTKSRRHFEAFAQWERIFDFLDSRPDLSHWRPRVYQQMIAQYMTVLRHPKRVPADARADFFHAASEHARRFSDGTESMGSPRQDQLLAMLKKDNYTGFRALRVVNNTASTGKKKLKKSKKNARKVASRGKKLAKRLEYRREVATVDLDPNLAVFAAYWNRGYACSPKAIYEAMRELAPHIHGVWVVREKNVDSLPPGVDYVIPGSRRYWSLMARAKYLVNNVNFPDQVIKRPGQVHVQTQHGTPLKHMGIDLMKHPAAIGNLVFEDLLMRSDRWDYNLTSNRFSSVVWQRAIPSNYETVESGYPRNDVLVNATTADVAAARARLGIPTDKRAVLYAPTHRDHDLDFTLRADPVRLAEQLGEDFVVLVRAHYFYEWDTEHSELERRKQLLNVSRVDSVEDLMLAADVLVTDYSSIMFDYANLDRPQVIFAPDWETYRDVRGVYFDLMELPPGHVATEQEELAELLRSGRYDDAESDALRARFRETFCEYDDGRAAERVVRHIFLGEGMTPIQPLAERTVAPRPSQIPEALAAAAAAVGDKAWDAAADRAKEAEWESTHHREGDEREQEEPDPGMEMEDDEPFERGAEDDDGDEDRELSQDWDSDRATPTARRTEQRD